jgi:L-aspartate semialdehyde sulfurtransferase ferredoxin
VHSKILILHFPKTEVQKPLVCQLAKDFDLTFNILKAEILPRKEGIMVLELFGRRKNFQEGIEFLQQHGIEINKAGKDVKRIKRKCTHCGACTAVCPTGALFVHRPEMTIEFDESKCSVCELCVSACPPRAMEIRPSDQAFFE